MLSDDETAMETLSTKEAAELAGISPQWFRNMMSAHTAAGITMGTRPDARGSYRPQQWNKRLVQQWIDAGKPYPQPTVPELPAEITQRVDDLQTLEQNAREASNKATAARRQLIQDLIALKLTRAQAAAVLGISRQSVDQILSKNDHRSG